MNNMLSSRLLCVAELVKGSGVVADIGCDHGKLSAYLLKMNYASFVYATDISEQSLNKARKLCESEKLCDVEFVCGDGFNALDKKVDAATVAGIGGDVISQIIDSEKAPDKLVLQPMKDSDKLYEKLFELGYFVKEVRIVKENGRFYEIILALRGLDTAYDFSLPPLERIVFDETAKMYLSHKIDVLNKARNGAKKADNFLGKARLEELSAEISKIEEVLKSASC